MRELAAHSPSRSARLLSILIPALAALIASASLLLFGAALLPEQTSRLIVAVTGPLPTARERIAQVIAERARVAQIAAVAGIGAASVLVYWRRILSESASSIINAFIREWVRLRRRGLRRRVSFNRAELVCLLIIVAAGFAVRLAYINRTMRYDETYTWLGFASKPLFYVLTRYDAPNNHIFHSFLVHISTALLGTAPWAIRLPSFLAGCLAPVATYFLAEQLAGSRRGLIAAALVAACPMLIEYSVNARGYTISAFLVAIMTMAGVAARRSGNILAFAVFVVSAWIGVWTLPTVIMALAGAGLWFACSLRTAHRTTRRVLARRALLSAAILGGLIAASYAPVVIVTGFNQLANNKFVSPRSWTTFLNLNSTELGYFSRYIFYGAPLEPAIPILAGLCAFLIFGRKTVLWGVVAAMCGGAAVFILGRQMVPFARVYLMYVPLLAAVLAHGVASLFDSLARSPSWLHRSSAIALACVGTVAVALSGAVKDSTETWLFRAAPEIAAFLREHNAHVQMGEPSKILLEYYGFENRPVDGRREEWRVINYEMEDSERAVIEEVGVNAILEARSFDGATLFRVPSP